jgi:hypothetical protein
MNHQFLTLAVEGREAEMPVIVLDFDYLKSKHQVKRCRTTFL